MARKKLKPIDSAREAALKGDIDTALPLLRECAAAGDDSACASLAEVLAFLGRWDECIPNAGRLLANPYAVHAGNVFDDMVRLLGRAGHETGQWQTIAATTVDAKGQVEERLRSNVLNFPEVKLEAERKRLCTILDRLADYARRKGAPPHELVRIFATSPADPAANETAYRQALEKNKKKPAARLLDFAIAFAVDAEAIRLFAEADNTTFEQTVFVAQALVRRGEPEKAWEALSSKVAEWSPVDAAQVAPVLLLTDEQLRQITTPERAERIIRTPRG